VRREGAPYQRVEVPPEELGRCASVAGRRGKARKGRRVTATAKPCDKGL
jgi:hypothetical protein